VQIDDNQYEEIVEKNIIGDYLALNQKNQNFCSNIKRE
jgi:hypothetical protein